MIKFNNKDITPMFGGGQVSKVLYNGKVIYPTEEPYLIIYFPSIVGAYYETNLDSEGYVTLPTNFMIETNQNISNLEVLIGITNGFQSLSVPLTYNNLQKSNNDLYVLASNDVMIDSTKGLTGQVKLKASIGSVAGDRTASVQFNILDCNMIYTTEGSDSYVYRYYSPGDSDSN